MAVLGLEKVVTPMRFNSTKCKASDFHGNGNSNGVGVGIGNTTGRRKNGTWRELGACFFCLLHRSCRLCVVDHPQLIHSLDGGYVKLSHGIMVTLFRSFFHFSTFHFSHFPHFSLGARRMNAVSLVRGVIFRL